MKINNTYEILTPNGFEDFTGVKKIKKKVITIIFDNNISLRTSYEHLIYHYDGKTVSAKDIKVGDKIISKNGFLTVTDVKKYNHKVTLYDIVNSGFNHIYYTNDIVSHNCSFLGSGDNVIETEIIIQQEKENCKDPIRKEWNTDLWIWKEPEQDHRYVAGLDVSRGDSDDSTGFTIIDFDTWEQVLEYHGKIPPDLAATLLQRYGIQYKAFTCIDITGGMGIATTRKLVELNYPTKLLYYDGLTALELFGGAPEGAIPGINFSARNNRVQIVQALEEAIRVGKFKIRSLRLTNELRKFVYVNGKPDHLRGAHDDLIMSLGMAIFVANVSFTQLQKNDAQLNAMAKSWKSFERKHDPIMEQSPAAVNNNVASEFKAPYMPESNPHATSQGRYAYDQYKWLFGVTPAQVEEYKKSGIEPAP